MCQANWNGEKGIFCATEKLAIVARKSKKAVSGKIRAFCHSAGCHLVLVWITAKRVPLAANPRSAILITIYAK